MGIGQEESEKENTDPLLLAISVCSESTSATGSKLVGSNEDGIAKSFWDLESQERDLMRGVVARAEMLRSDTH